MCSIYGECKDKQVKKDGRGGGVCWGWIYVCWIAGIPESESTVTDRLVPQRRPAKPVGKLVKVPNPGLAYPQMVPNYHQIVRCVTILPHNTQSI